VRHRVRAPELTGRGWLNTGGRAIDLASLRGKIILLDFWTFCCINCLHVLDELRPLEQKYEESLVLIGVHSPKFEHEKDAAALADAVERYGIEHPVLDDPQMTTWRQYAARAWPTLALIDPEGYVVKVMAGEGHAPALDRLIGELVQEHKAKGTLRWGDSPYVPPKSEAGSLRFPGKVAVSESGTYFVSSSAQHQIVEFEADGETVKRRIGDGTRGLKDGPAANAQFSEPQGLCFLPSQIAAQAGYDLIVADTVNHALRGIDTKSGAVITLAGTGEQLRHRQQAPMIGARGIQLSSPWDVAWFENRLIIAMAGIHQLWWFDPIAETIGVYAGTTVEALRDGHVSDVWMAQPSGLSTDGDRLWVADSETSALRYVQNDVMHTAVGQGLFDFGLIDGPAEDALFQHPLGVCAVGDGAVLVADTYNGALRNYDMASNSVSTLLTGLAEPSDVTVTPEGDFVVVESSAHRLTFVSRSVLDEPADADGRHHRIERPLTEVSSGEVTLEVMYSVPDGQKLDRSFGDPIRIEISASPPGFLVEGDGISGDLSRRLLIADDATEGVLQVVAQIATCDSEAEFPACHLLRQDWGVPVKVSGSGTDRISLVLSE
jgi:thiol-disulfide isomerase/thioredoxin